MDPPAATPARIDLRTHPDFERERDETLRGRLWVIWLASAIMLAFWGLDLLVAPEHAWLFLAYRLAVLAAASAAAIVGQRARSPRVLRVAAVLGCMTYSLAIATMTFSMGGFSAAYTVFFSLPLYCGAIALPWTLSEIGVVLGTTTAYFFLGNFILLLRGVGTWVDFAQAFSFVTTVDVFCFLTVWLGQRARWSAFLQRRELALKTESLERTVKDLRERESRLAAIGRMTSNVVHDLRNPLTSILTLTRVAQSAVAKGRNAVAFDDLAGIQTAGLRIQKMLSEILGFARGSAVVVKPSPARVNEILRAAVEPLASDLARRQIVVNLDVQGASGAVASVDRDALVRVIENLVRNAAEAIEARASGSEASGPSQVRGRVRIRAQRTDASLTVRFEDDGCGIPSGIRDDLFQPFVTTGKPGGTGLGLATSREVVRAMGGDLVLEPPPAGGGAAFRLTLPLDSGPA